MMKTVISLVCLSVFSWSSGQKWQETNLSSAAKNRAEKHYLMDLNEMRSMLKNSHETGKDAKPVILSLPTLEGKIERFTVYSNPVVEKSLAERYGLGSYIGVGIDDPTKYLRFSTSPNDFQSMIIKNGEYQFIEPINRDLGIYKVSPPTVRDKTPGETKNWCGTGEDLKSKKELQRFIDKNKSDAVLRNEGFTMKASDKTYRNYRMAISVNGEYTQYYGSKSAAVAAINATMTKVNGIYEKEMAVHFTVLDIPELIYEDPNTDPYPDYSMDDMNAEVQKVLTQVVGNDNYDIGHLFVQNTGNALGSGLVSNVGSICNNTTSNTDQKKGAAHSAIDNPSGDTFIKVVAHEIGHQLGANHIYSHSVYNNFSQVEPGSGSTIMGYAGIVGIAGANVQNYSDHYFNTFNLTEMQNLLSGKTCGQKTLINNNPPVINPMSEMTIPKETPFVLTASAVDPDGDTFSYNWEQADPAAKRILTTTGTNEKGAIVRSRIPVNSPTRYIPKLDLVMNGILTSTSEWESVPRVARELNFKVTTRDNNINPQTSNGSQKIKVGEDGPFKIISQSLYTNIESALRWDVANTNANPYNVVNVKIDYTTDNGATWITLADSTPNDGTENFILPSTLLNQSIKVRVSAKENIFYTISTIAVSEAKQCDGSAPNNLSVSDITASKANLNWEAIQNATYIVKYKKESAAAWIETTVNTNYFALSGLEEETKYEVQVAAVCSGVAGTYSLLSFSTLAESISYCIPDLDENDSRYEYISNVTVGNMNNSSGGNGYADYTADPAKIVNLVIGSTGNNISVKKAWTGYQDPLNVNAWIDFNRNGIFESSEKILSTPANKINPVSGTFSVPASAVTGKKLRMRVILKSFSTPPADACATDVSEVEDYAVKIVSNETLNTNDLIKNPKMQIYPNPAENMIRITSLQGKASYKIYNMEGRLIASGIINNNTINVSQLVKAAYTLVIETDTDKYTHKFIKK